MTSVVVPLPRRKRSAEAGQIARVLVVGCPNTGKTSLMNRLAGTNLRVGNYPGVTVEGASASVTLPSGAGIDLVDLPGTYSLCGRSAEERIAIDALLGRRGQPPPDAVLLVVDVTQLEHGMYVVLQVAELGIPCLLALSMKDEADALGVELDVAALRDAIGMPVVPVSSRTREGLDALHEALDSLLATTPTRPPYATSLPEPVVAAALRVAAAMPPDWAPTLPSARDARALRRALGLWALMSVEGGDEDDAPASLVDIVDRERRTLIATGFDADHVIAAARHGDIERHVRPLIRRGRERAITERLDRVLVHPVWGLTLFLVLMTALFQGLFSWSDPAISAIEAAVSALSALTTAALPAGLLHAFVTDAVFGGVGSVLVFLPQIVLLFLLIGLMEDSGYMARVAYLMDRVMRSVGLHGRAFVPMLSGFACAVPAILATRTMERKRDRLLTMMVVPLTLCSARLPVYTLLIGALFPPTLGSTGLPVQGLLLVAMYAFSIVTALVAAAVLGRTVLKGRNEPLLLELPPYRLPAAATVLRMVGDRARTFVFEAGTVIFACTVVLWALLAFPRIDVAALPAGTPPETAQLNASYGAALGHAIEPAIAPLGFDWKIGVGLVGAFAAREVFVATMGVVYGADTEATDGDAGLRAAIRAERHADGRPVYSPLVGLSLMVFFSIACQCMSTLAAVRRETKSWRWPLFLFAWMTALAWSASFVVYQGGRTLGL